MSALALAACADPDSLEPGPGFGGVGNPVQGGNGGQNGGGGGGSGGGGGGSSSGGGDEMCASIEIGARHVPPTVWLVVDASGSMLAPMEGSGGRSRWTVLRDALLDSGSGLVPELEDIISFGLFAYDGGLSLPGIKTPACPRVIEIGPALDNYDRISGAYPANPMGASTPTNYALLELKDRIRASLDPDQQSASYVILATDGRPNLCDFHDGVPETAETSAEAVRVVGELADLGIKTFAISMAGNDATLNAHLEKVAEAGQTGLPPFTPSTADELVQALTEILRGAVTCEVELDGELMAGYACNGEVKLNGNLLECEGEDGFRVKDDRKTLVLQGSACETVKHDPRAGLEANFPCDVVVF